MHGHSGGPAPSTRPPVVLPAPSSAGGNATQNPTQQQELSAPSSMHGPNVPAPSTLPPSVVPSAPSSSSSSGDTNQSPPQQQELSAQWSSVNDSKWLKWTTTKQYVSTSIIGRPTPSSSWKEENYNTNREFLPKEVYEGSTYTRYMCDIPSFQLKITKVDEFFFIFFPFPK